MDSSSLYTETTVINEDTEATRKTVKKGFLTNDKNGSYKIIRNLRIAYANGEKPSLKIKIKNAGEIFLHEPLELLCTLYYLEPEYITDNDGNKVKKEPSPPEIERNIGIYALKQDAPIYSLKNQNPEDDYDSSDFPATFDGEYIKSKLFRYLYSLTNCVFR